MKQILSFICCIAAIACAVIAMYTPPMAVIDSSVLWFTAQLLVFTASMLGIDLKIIPFKNVFKTDSHSQSGEDL